MADTPTPEQQPAPEQLPVSDKLRENIKLDTTEKKLEELKKDVNFDKDPVSEETINKALHEYYGARKETKEALTDFINKFNTQKDTMDSTTYQDYAAKLEALKSEYNQLDKPGKFQREEVKGKKAEREEKREKLQDAEKDKINQLLNAELGPTARDTEGTLANIIQKYSADYSTTNETIKYFYNQITQYRDKGASHHQVAQQFIDTAKAYVLYRVTNRSWATKSPLVITKISSLGLTRLAGMENNAFVLWEINDLTIQNMGKKAQESYQYYVNTALDAGFWKRGVDKTMLHDRLTTYYNKRLKSLPNDATEEEKQNYTTYIQSQWGLLIGTAYNGDDDKYRSLSPEEVNSIVSSRKSILDFKEWKEKYNK